MFPGCSVSCSSADVVPPSLSTCMQGSEKWERRIVAERCVLLACPVIHPIVVWSDFCASRCVRRGTLSLPSRRVPVVDSKVSKRCQNFISTIPGMSNAASSQGVLSRAQNFVSENKKVIIASVAVVAVVGVAAAAYYSTSTNTGLPRVPRDDLEHGKSPSAKKKSKKHKKGLPTAGPRPTSGKLDDVNGPVLEEHARTDSPGSVLQHTCFHLSTAHFATRSTWTIE